MPEDVDRVRAGMQRSPKSSARRHSQTLEISRRSLHMFKAYFKFHPYKLQVVQTLQPNNHQMRMAFCVQLRKMITDNDMLPNLLVSDKAHFHLIGSVNKKNVLCLPDTNPQLLHETPMHSPNHCEVRCSKIWV